MLSLAEMKSRLTELHETVVHDLSEGDLRQQLKKISRQRLLKVWHDHSEIGGHSHLLVLVACVYDPAFYYTPQEMQLKGKDIDVPMVVEDPEIHNLGRSSSSLCDQMQYIECRRECLLGLAEGLVTKAGILVHDLMRFFHGDGPAMQFEAGNKIGGHYCCVGCKAHSSRFDHLAYCFHARHLTLSERQDFILQGEAWKRTIINALDNLKVAKLRTELEKRGYSTMGKKMAQLEKEFPFLFLSVQEVLYEVSLLQFLQGFPLRFCRRRDLLIQVDLSGHLTGQKSIR